MVDARNQGKRNIDAEDNGRNWGKGKARVGGKAKTLANYLLIVAGSVITAAGINIFLAPNRIAPGGVTGIATVAYHVSGGRLPVGLTMLALNVPLFIVGMKFIGKRFIIRTLFGTILLSAMVDATRPMADYIVEAYFTRPEYPYFTQDILLYSLFGGFLMGTGLGMVFRAGATTGGSDLAAKIINNFAPTFTIGQVLLFIDAIIAIIVFKSVIIGLYAMIAIFISSKTIDTILEGVNFVKAAYIISDKSGEISGKIMRDMDRGVTALKGTGMYTGRERDVLLCILHRAQISQLKQIVREIDPRAFVILADVREVLGEGFSEHITEH